MNQRVRVLLGASCLCVVIGLASSVSAASPASGTHPVITEVLFAVPSGKEGDANADGTRDAVGDEFVEIINPTSAPIRLKGYQLLDADAYAPGAAKPVHQMNPSAPADPAATPGAKPSQPRAHFAFTFPDVTLQPGQVAVVFNGYKATFTGAVGDASSPPTGPNDRFHKALVFTIKNTSPYAAFSNDADFVLLLDPSGAPVECVRWGEAGSGAGKTPKNPPAACPKVEDAPACIGSVQRTSLTGKLVCHRDLVGDLKGSNFSPGLFGPSATDATAASSPATAPALAPTASPAKPAGKRPDRPAKPKPAGDR